MATIRSEKERGARAAWPDWLSVIVLCTAVVICYLPAVGAPWIFDSIKLANDPLYQNVTPIWTALSRSTRSFTEWTFAVQYRLFGPSRLAYSLVNIGIHLLATLSLWGVARRTLLFEAVATPLRRLADGVALTISLLWAIHPLQTQAVTYTIQRHESLMGAMFFLALYLFIRGCQSERAAAWYLGTIAACVVGMASKTVMVTFPIVVLLYDIAFVPGGFKSMVRQRWWLFLFLFASAAWGILDIRGALDPDQTDVQSVGMGLAVVTPWEYLRTQPQVILHYLRLVFWPAQLSIDYMWPIANSPLEIWGMGAVILALVATGLIGLRYWPKTAFLILSFFVVLAPTSSLVPIRDLAVEHRLYVPSAAVIALAVCGWWMLCELLQEPAARKFARIGLVVVAGLSLAGRTTLRNTEYQFPTKLWESALRISPGNFRAHNVLGHYARDRGDWDLARKYYEQAIAIDDTYPPAHYALAGALAREGEYAAAEKEYETTVRLDPRFSRAYDNWGNMYARQGDLARARAKYIAAIEADPYLATAHMHLGLVQFQEHSYADAKQSFTEALRLSPNLREASVHLAMILSCAPEPDLRDEAQGLTLTETWASQGQTQSAKELDARAMAQAANGKFSQAVETIRHARHLAMADNDEKLLGELEKRATLYRNQQPYRLPK